MPAQPPPSTSASTTASAPPAKGGCAVGGAPEVSVFLALALGFAMLVRRFA